MWIQVKLLLWIHLPSFIVAYMYMYIVTVTASGNLANKGLNITDEGGLYCHILLQ